MRRKGMGLGRGQGYKNISLRDPLVHSLSAKGVKQKKPILTNISTFKLKDVTPKIIPDNFGIIPTYRKKGLIRELARKVQQGVEWAVEWEKEHLPKQKAWVKKEYADAKDLAKKGLDKVKEYAEHKKDDMDDVRDELDVDNDGVQDISIKDLEDVNKGIRNDLETIDMDADNVPDYRDTEQPLDITSEEHIRVKEKKPSLFPTIKAGAKRIFTSGEAFVRTKVAEEKVTREEMSKISSPELKELAIRNKTLFGGNRYEQELLRRIKSEGKIDKHIVRAKARAERKGKSINGDYFGFLNPLAVGKK